VVTKVGEESTESVMYPDDRWWVRGMLLLGMQQPRAAVMRR
jgi:hypothetical protein